MRISEIFYSIQGEGRLAGMPSVFIRTSGCNLRCVWCDTPYTSWKPEGANWSLAKVLREVQKYPTHYVVITGGEPLAAPQIEELARELKQRGAHITIETAATIYKPIVCDLMSMSPKLANSTPWERAHGRFAKMHEERRIIYRSIRQYLDQYDYQLKLSWNEGRLCSRLAPSGPTFWRPVPPESEHATRDGTGELRRKGKWIVELCKEIRLPLTRRGCKFTYGNRRCT